MIGLFKWYYFDTKLSLFLKYTLLLFDFKSTIIALIGRYYRLEFSFLVSKFRLIAGKDEKIYFKYPFSFLLFNFQDKYKNRLISFYDIFLRLYLVEKYLFFLFMWKVFGCYTGKGIKKLGYFFFLKKKVQSEK